MTRKILIIDDDKIFSKILKDNLVAQDAGAFAVEVAHDGEEGIARIIESRPDLIVSDLVMPKVGGLELIKRLKSEGDLANIPVLVSTNTPDMDKISEVMTLGAKGYIIKSDYAIDIIVKKIKDVLGMN